MTRADLRTTALACEANHVGLGAFNVVQLETAEAIVEAATFADVPVILQISENAATYHGALAPLGMAVIEIANAAPIPVIVHLDHAESVELIYEAVNLGFDSVMFDGSRLTYAQNETMTAEVVRYCHDRGVAVEAELGEIGGKNGVHDPTTRTSPQQAGTFVERTGADLLAVAVGSSHAMTTSDAVLDTKLVAAIRAAVPVPLVLHGSSGASDATIQLAIHAGITKVNVSTRLNRVFTTAISRMIADHPENTDPRTYFQAGNVLVRDEVEHLLRLYAQGELAPAGRH